MRRVKAVDVVDDDYYNEDVEYDQEEELSSQDKESMSAALIATKAEINDSFQVTDKEIEDALWYYYFDVGKTVGYLRGLKVGREPKATPAKTSTPTKGESRFDKAAKVAQEKAFAAVNEPLVGEWIGTSFLGVEDTSELQPAWTLDHAERIALARQFFSDISWGSVSKHRLSTLTHVSSVPKLGLLGGAPKSSKLAALAASRKKQSDDKKKAEEAAVQDSHRAVSLLDRLGSKRDSTVSPAKEAESLGMEKLRVTGVFKPRTVVSQNDSAPTLLEPSAMEPAPPVPKAEPSTFAAALCGVENQTTQGASLEPGSNNRSRSSSLVFGVPYTTNEKFLKADPFAKPSAPSVKKAKTASTKPATSTAPMDPESSVTKGVDELTLEPPTKVNRKNLNVLAEYQKSNLKKSSSFVVIGHVDHGKSTLMGRLLYDLKVVNDKTMHKYQQDADKIGKGSFAFAWVMDSGTDERERGITVDIATRNFDTEKTSFTILDAPGHQDFIPNMIAGTGQADFALLVIDAGVNSFESGLRGQTKEHAILARSMGIQRLIVVVNKMDKTDWSQERFEEIETLMAAFLVSANYKKSAVQFIPCAGLTGENIMQGPPSEHAAWYTGPTLVEALDSMESTTRAIEKPLRMVISELMQSGSSGVSTAVGKIDAGSIQVGDSVIVQPSSQTAVIRSIEQHDEPKDWAVAGQNVTVRLGSIDPGHVHQGDIICSSTDIIPNVSHFKAKVITFEHMVPMFVEIHHGRMQVSGKVAKLVATLDKETGKIAKKNPRILQPGMPARIEIELDNTMPLEAKQRIVLRAEGRTIAAGVVE